RLPGHHDRLLAVDGGGRRAPDLCAGRRVQLRQGPAGAGRAGEPRLPVGAVQERPDPQHRSGGRKVTPQEMVERALELSTADGCVVLADERSTANLRFAGNTLTTNGVARSSRLPVISVAGQGVGGTSRAAVRPAQPASASWDEPVTPTGIDVFTGFAPALGEAFSAAESGGRKLYGFAEHTLTSTFLGSSTGLRLRHDQPTGRLELNAKSSDLKRSAWTGVATRDFSDVDVAALDGGLAQRLDWAKTRVDLPAGRYETLLPPAAVADLMIYMFWSAGARDALDGRSVFSKPGGGT